MIRTSKPTHPGEILKEFYLDELKISISDFAERINVSRKTISGIVNGRKSVTPEMAVRFAMAFPNTTPELWTNLQRNCDLFEAEKIIQEKHISITPFAVPALA